MFPSRSLAAVLIVAAAVLPASAEVAYDFATDAGPFVASDDATSVQWSESHGGSLELTFAPGWKPRVARLDLSADPALWAEYQQALATGGTIRYNIIVRHDDIVGSAPGWFESIWIGNTNGCWDQQFGGSDGQIGLYGAGAFPAGGVTTIEVSYPIEAGAAVRDRRAQFSAGSGWNEIFLGMNSGGGGYSGARYFIDNFSVVANAAPPPPVIPDLTIEPARQGLHLIAAGGSRWDRQTVRTTIPEHSWVGRGSPVTYRFGLSSFPQLPEFGAFLYLVPGTDIPATNSGPDWSQPVCMVAAISGAANGSANLRLSYKNHTADSNGTPGHEYWVDEDGSGQGGTVGRVNSTTSTGEWSLTFTSDTAFVLTAPDGTTTSGDLLPSVAARFSGPLFAYFGIWPTQDNNRGATAVASRIAINGTPSPIDERFLTDSLPASLERSAAAPEAVVLVGPSARFWAKWSLPASGFELQQSPKLGNSPADWSPIPVTDAFTVSGSTRWKLLSITDLADPATNYFRLARP